MENSGSDSAGREPLFLYRAIKVGPDKASEDAELFAKYVGRYNKSYRNDSAEYNKRFECFQVNDDETICSPSRSRGNRDRLK